MSAEGAPTASAGAGERDLTPSRAGAVAGEILGTPESPGSSRSTADAADLYPPVLDRFRMDRRP